MTDLFGTYIDTMSDADREAAGIGFAHLRTAPLERTRPRRALHVAITTAVVLAEIGATVYFITHGRITP